MSLHEFQCQLICRSGGILLLRLLLWLLLLLLLLLRQVGSSLRHVVVHETWRLLLLRVQHLIWHVRPDNGRRARPRDRHPRPRPPRPKIVAHRLLGDVEETERLVHALLGRARGHRVVWLLPGPRLTWLLLLRLLGT